MRKQVIFILIGVICFGFISGAYAQVAVTMQLNRKHYLMYEQVLAKVSFRNYSGRPLIFGQNPKLRGKVTFRITSPNGSIISENKINFNPLIGTVLKPGATGSAVFPLTKMYNLRKAGSYSVLAILSHPLLSSAYNSGVPMTFTIFNGIPVWKRILGVPEVLNNKATGKIKKRTAEILNFYDNNRKLYALKIEDDQYVYGVVRLAEDVDENIPQIEVDGLNRVHIFVQISSRVWDYFVYNIDCKLVEKGHYTISDDGVKPILVRNADEGTVMVIGGKKAIAGTDFVKDSNPNPFFNE